MASAERVIIYRGDDNRHYEKIGNEVKDITEEIDFDLPEGWVYVRISTICWLDDIKATIGEKLPYLDAKTLRGKTDKVYLTRGKIIEPELKIILVDGENSGEVFDVPYRGYMGSTFKILGISKNINTQYLGNILYFFRDLFKGNKIGAAIPHLNKPLFKSLLIGLPPLEEQERIVTEIEKYAPLLSEYVNFEQLKSKLDSEICDKLKKSILQYAIQGKLVPQNPNDEPASVLLERIRAEKKAKLGKKYVDSYIYKGDDNCYYEKIGTAIKNITEEIPFEIPETWAWSRLNTFIDFSKNETVKATAIQKNDWVLDLEDIEKGNGKLMCKKRMRDVLSKSDKHKFEVGNVLYSKLRPYLNKIIIADENGYCTTEILVFDFDQQIINRYAQIYLMSPFFVDYAMAGAYGVKMPRIGSERGNQALIPIPPYNEQQRIYKAFNTFLSIIDKCEN